MESASSTEIRSTIVALASVASLIYCLQSRKCRKLESSIAIVGESANREAKESEGLSKPWSKVNNIHDQDKLEPMKR
jgi:hypothetical protein